MLKVFSFAAKIVLCSLRNARWWGASGRQSETGGPNKTNGGTLESARRWLHRANAIFEEGRKIKLLFAGSMVGGRAGLAGSDDRMYFLSWRGRIGGKASLRAPARMELRAVSGWTRRTDLPSAGKTAVVGGCFEGLREWGQFE